MLGAGDSEMQVSLNSDAQSGREINKSRDKSGRVR